MIRRLSLLLCVLLLVCQGGATHAQSPITLELLHLGPNALPGPWLLHVRHSGAAIFIVRCLPPGEAEREINRVPTFNYPSDVQLISAGAPCPSQSTYTVVLIPWLPGDAGPYGAPVSFGPFGEQTGPNPQSPPVSRPHQVALPLIRGSTHGEPVSQP